MGSCVTKGRTKTASAVIPHKNYVEHNDILDRWTEPQVRLLKRKFNKCKTDSGLNQLGFFKLFPELETFPPTIRQSIFNQFQPAGTEGINFRDFCVVLARALIGTKDEKADFVFRIFDLDGDGNLSQTELSGMLEACAKKLRPLSLDLATNIQLHMKRLNETNASVTSDVFIDWAKRNLELTDLLGLFEIVPSPLGEKSIIKGFQKKAANITYKQKIYLVSSKWWDVWKRYVNYDAPMMTEVEESVGEYSGVRPANRQKTIVVGDKPVEIDNSGLVDPANKLVLRKGLTGKRDYVILVEEAWADLYSWYGGGPEICRVMSMSGAQLKPELYPPIVKVYLADNLGKLRRDAAKTFLLSETYDAVEISKIVQESLKLPADLPIRLWVRDGVEWRLCHMNQLPELSRDYDSPKELLVERPNFIAGVVVWPKDSLAYEVEKDWKDFQVGDKLQIQRAPSLWTEAVVIEVSGTDVQVQLTRENNRLERLPRNSEDLAPLGSKAPSLVPQRTKPLQGASGLVNLGNTCYVNCIVQCLANTPLLKDFFKSQTQYQYINTANPNGTKGKVAEELGSLIKIMWEGRNPAINPASFFKVMGRLFSQFDGHEQHDCHEFLSIVLDSLHEDLNRLQEGSGHQIMSLKNPTPEEETTCANQQWKELQGSKGSVISDLCGGQTRTTLLCSQCQAKTVIFETYMYLSVPLPVSTEMTLYLTVVPPEGPVRKFGIVISKFSLLEDLVNKVVELSQMQREKILIAEMYMFKIYIAHDVGQKEPIRKLGIRSKSELLAFEVHWSIEQAEGDGRKTLPPNQIQSEISILEPGMQVDILNEKEGWTSALIEGARPTRTKTEVQISYEHEGEEKIEWVSQGSGRLAPFRSRSKQGRDEVFALPVVNRRLDPATGKMEPMGIPLLVSIGNWYTFADLHRHLQKMLRRFIAPNRMRRKVSLKALTNGSHPSGLSDFRIELPYTIKILDQHGFHCADCGPKCMGCPLPSKKISLSSFTKRVMLGVDWADGSYNFDVPNHPSVLETIEEEEKLNQSLDLMDCFRAFTKEEKVDTVCEACKVQSISMKMEIWRSPDILIINLKRFSFQAGVPEKIDQMIQYPVYALDISEFVRGIKASNGLTLSTTILQSAYDLYAVVNHAGSMEGGKLYIGHYTSFCAMTLESDSEDKWLLLDDEHVMEVVGDVSNVVVNKNAYLLFYKRRKMAASNVINLTYQA